MNTNGFYFKLRIFLTAVLLAVGVVANADVYSGVGGEDIVWTLDTETGVLEISGTGSTSEHSWKEYSEYIKKVIVHDGVKHIADRAFSGCTNLVEAIIGNDVERIGYFAFENCFSLEYVDLGEGIRSFGGYAFSSCKSLRTIELPNGLTTIEGGGFRFSGLRSVTIPSSVTSIDLGIFDYCEDLEQIIIDEANPVYDSRNNCNAVIETSTGLLVEGCNATIIPEGVTSIGNGAFGGCRKLSSVTIPSTVTYIDAYAFFECNAIKSMISLIEPGNLMEVMTCAFDGMDRENCVLYVPVGAKDVYSVTGGWRDFKNIIELGDTIPAGDIDTPEDCEWSFRLTEADGLLGEDISEGAGNQYRFQSSNFVLPAPTTSIRFTVIETVSNLNLNGYKYTAFGEFTILDAEGNSVPYKATTNADHNLLSGFEDGGGLPALNDGDYSTFFHTVWNGDQVPKEYHYVEFAFEEPINEFSLDIVWREHEYGNRLRATLAYLLPGGSCWNGEEPGNETPDTGADEEGENADSIAITTGEAIDLGLSVKWASCNVGAQSPEEYGDYLQWDGSDLAHSALGGKWFMPTLEEGQELIDKCTWEWCELNGVTGYKVTGPNGNSIFLPATGWKHSNFSDDVSVGIEGNYWTITPSELYSPGMASYDLQFHDDGRIFMSPHSMAMGFQTVRAVYREDYAGEDVEPLKYIDIYDTDACLAIDSVGTYDIVAYTRIFDATDWEAWYMPFDVPYSSLQEDLDVAYINNIHQYDDDNDGVIDRTEIEAIKMTDGVLKANFPYVVRAKESGLFVWEWEYVTIDPQINSYSCSSMYNTYTFFGSYNYIEPGELQGAYMLGADGYMVSSESMQLGAFRFYLSIESKGVTGPSMSANIRLRVRGDEAATGIETVEGVESSVIYDLSGRVVTEITEPGIYIVNGKKVAIR